MRKILIVGAGQSGLLLAHGLQQAGGYEVTVLAGRTPDEIRQGWPTSTQVLFDPCLTIERQLGLDLWAAQTPNIAGLHLTVAGPPGQPRLEVHGALDAPAQSTDQRLKMAGWLEAFEQRGGTVHHMGVSTRDLDALADSGRYDLIVVAAGRGELTALFDRDPARSPYDAPQRGLAVAYVHGMGPDPDSTLHPNVTFTALPGAGELILIPALSVTGPCDIVFFEAVPGGPLDVFGDRPDPAEHLTRSVTLIQQYMPWLFERCANLELTDARATLTGRYAPTVRRPIGELPSGGLVFGAADVVIANDPIVAQGANTATRCAAAYLAAIVAHGDRPFDRQWMTETFEKFWADTGQQVTAWTNGMLGPPPPHVQQLLGAASQIPEVANRFANGFADPNDLLGWFMTPDAAAHYLGQLADRVPSGSTTDERAPVPRQRRPEPHATEDALR